MRSLLFVPGDSDRKLEKALACGADALIVDLEDSVAATRKGAAREVTAAFLRQARSIPQRPLLHVRVNALDTAFVDDDLAGIMPAGPDGIVLPKAVGGQSVQALAARLAVQEAEHGLPDGGTRILAIATENARGLLAIATLQGASPRLMGVTWGGEDLAADLGAETNRDEAGRYTDPYRLARAMALLAAAAAEVEPIDSVFTNFRDGDGLARECREARRDGFTGKMAIHPAQVPIINEAFTPRPEAVARARRIVEAFAAEPGLGVIGLDGEMIDGPHLTQARRLLARAGQDVS